MEKEYFLIVCTESDEIHFLLMDMIHYDKVIEGYTEFANRNWKNTELFLTYCYDNMIENFYIQTYCDEPWIFGKYNIKRIISVPEFGC